MLCSFVNNFKKLPAGISSQKVSCDQQSHGGVLFHALENKDVILCLPCFLIALSFTRFRLLRREDALYMSSIRSKNTKNM